MNSLRTFLWVKHRLHFAAVIGLLVMIHSIAGCAGTVIVEYALDVKITGRDPTGRIWQASSDQFTVEPLPAGMLVSFPAVRYRSAAFEWFVGTGTLGFGGDFTNFATSPLCFHFEQVSMTSNLQPKPVLLRVFHVSQTLAGKWTRLGDTDPNSRMDFAPPALCLPSGQSGRISLAPNLKELFPNRTMFNVSWPKGETTLIENGVGNWIKLVLPIDYEGKTETLDITLTVKDSKARISHY